MRSHVSNKLISQSASFISLPAPLEIQYDLTRPVTLGAVGAVDGTSLDAAKLDEPARAPTLTRVGPQPSWVRVFPQAEANWSNADGNGEECDPRILRISIYTKNKEIFF